MRLTIFALAMLSAALPAAASADTAPVGRFTHEGVTYSYNVTTTSYGQLVKGMADNKPFVLKVRDGRVSGSFTGRSVSFKLSEVRPVFGIVEVALR